MQSRKGTVTYISILSSCHVAAFQCSVIGRISLWSCLLFAYDLFEDFEANKEVAYTFVNNFNDYPREKAEEDQGIQIDDPPYQSDITSTAFLHIFSE